MPSKRHWLRLDVVLAIHEAQIAEHGGSPGVRDTRLLESALARPLNAAASAEPKPDVPMLASLYALGIIRNHPFIDGNKRTGLVLLESFLNLNGYSFTATDKECLENILGAAEGRLADDAFADWVRKNTVRQKR